ncbi:MAG: hypothetical protein HY914_05180 [Desulfomonile tiedjei]|nr:hypothetical protein [Desulfomonile tiedjei]
MRPLVAALIWLILLGGLTLYMTARQGPNRAISQELSRAEGLYSLVLTPTFDVEPDPFALQTDSSEKPAALVVKLNGTELVRMVEKVEGGKTIRVEPIKGLVQGKNEFYFEASPLIPEAQRSEALRVRILRDGRIIEDRSFWSEDGVRIAETFSVNLETSKPSQENGHEH